MKAFMFMFCCQDRSQSRQQASFATTTCPWVRGSPGYVSQTELLNDLCLHFLTCARDDYVARSLIILLTSCPDTCSRHSVHSAASCLLGSLTTCPSHRGRTGGAAPEPECEMWLRKQSAPDVKRKMAWNSCTCGQPLIMAMQVVWPSPTHPEVLKLQLLSGDCCPFARSPSGGIPCLSGKYSLVGVNCSERCNPC